MTEADWLASDEPAAMLKLAMGEIGRQRTGSRLAAQFHERIISDRKLRLFACECCRRWKPLTSAKVDELEQVGERYGLSDLAWAQAWARGEDSEERRREAATMRAFLLRDVIGNPFRLVFLPWRCRECGLAHGPPAAGYYCVRCGCDESYCPWLTPSVVALARCIYESRGFEDMPVLADALEEAGCDEPCRFCDGKGYHETGLVRCDQSGIHDSRQRLDCVACKGTGRVTSSMIEHLRSVGPHVRGCWVLDLLLGKE